ncbi:MAG: AIDA repeat-containing protein, partial [Lentisphaeria bacterium]|nr:AIDA repeat-containing protein [Lentisphaeria bacterium]
MANYIVSSGQISGGIILNNYDSMTVLDSGTANSTTVNQYGNLYVSSGGTATGKLTFGTNGSAYFGAGGILDFDLTKTYTGGAVHVNDLSVVQGTPSYTLTVSGSLLDGTYNLAEGATGFDKTITVRNTLGTELGTLTVGETQKLGGMNYTLTLTGSALSVEIDGTPDPDITKPVVSNVQASIITATNQNMTVTADFADDVAVASKLYRIGDGAWTDYTDGVTVTENATVYFKAIDTSSNESEVVSYAVTNIDKIPPAKPTASADVTEKTYDSVTVTAVFSGDTAKK